MQTITPQAAASLVHALRAQGHLIWYINAKVILLLPHQAVSVKNELELNRGLRDAGYLQPDQCLTGASFAAFQHEARETMLDAAEWHLEFGPPAARTQLAAVRHDIAGVKALLTQHVGHMNYDAYLQSMGVALPASGSFWKP